MKTVIDPKQNGTILLQWRGADAKIWMFDVSLKRLGIRLSRKDEAEVLYIVAITCEHIVGQFSWKNADLLVATGRNNEYGEPICSVTDSKAGFELLCSSVVLVKGPATDLDKTFDSFLGDACPG